MLSKNLGIARETISVYLNTYVPYTNSFSSIQKAAEYFNVEYRSVLNHLDTELATKKGDYLVYFFSNELTYLKKKELLNNLKIAKNETTPI